MTDFNTSLLGAFQLGGYIKVQLPGERPWAIVRRIYPDGSWDGEINNDLVSEQPEERRREIAQYLGYPEGHVMPVLHNFKCGDLLRFEAPTIAAPYPAIRLKADA